MSFDDVIELAKRRGFFWPSYMIYGGSSGFYDYGPLGTLLKDNIIAAWKREYAREGAIFLDTPVISPADVFRASGHLEKFSDIAVKCSKCGTPYKFESLIKSLGINEIAKTVDEAAAILEKYDVKCPKCGEKLKNPYDFNLMFRVGSNDLYLRPETAQGIFINFKNLYNYARNSMPIIVCQVGKGFRNEISPRQALIRMREFSQAEVEVFYIENDDFPIPDSSVELNMLRNTGDLLKMKVSDALRSGIIGNRVMAYFLNKTYEILLKLGFQPDHIRAREHDPGERAHYSSETWDFEYLLDGDWTEIVGVSDRGTYDLGRHQQFSGENFQIDGRTPKVVEPSYGLDRILLTIMDSSYYRRENGYKVLRLDPHISPIHMAIFPLQKRDDLDKIAKDLFEKMKNIDPFIFYDDSGNIGRRYARQDEIGTPFCVTVDYQTKDDETVTIRERDSTSQVRVKISDLLERTRSFPDSLSALFSN
ncbi:glycyl-tRNA synthetase related [Thermoplasma acidophilum]|uniref:glycine--tRNA ligase n=1 Tax=Thermoplasma acidophilum (strain ATCC 25905 / DSM 1728 / JCM 9062 / NBRC 15155 / AMRC-C165) TaxID=273075 RepID=Q9HLM1_THEAC|nr:glycine--tRNA ligase [Thermoplasma acidophilum]CAC11352.1 glycyl-tRNA synthetase related [Thermoplasma acidophilum]